MTSKRRPTASVPESYFGLEAVSSRAVSMLDVGEVLKERFRVGNLVGPGPVGALFSGRDITTDTRVALKVFAPNLVQDEDDRKQIRLRFKKLSQINHPNVATLYDLVESGPRIVIVSEFIEGVTLRQVIDLRRKEGKHFSFQEILPILEQICIGLAAYSNIAHGALKPENIFIIPEGVKLTDFNLP
ncbi:MAG: protein kinase, partial [Phycisphaerae bacterium]|nr:protein kinase [Phycisphaerae bacterium]